MAKECELRTLPSNEALLEMMPASWTKDKTLPVTVEWTTDQSVLIDTINRHPNWRYSAEDLNFSININTVHRCKSPDIQTIGIIRSALNKWSDISGKQILFKRVSKLQSENGGITFTAPVSYEELERTAFTTATDNNGILTSSVVVLPDNFFTYNLKTGMQEYVEELITHEIGHALGIKGHPHHSNELVQIISSATNSAHCTIMDYNRLTSPEVIDCKSKDPLSWVCHKETNNTAPGLLDSMIIGARLKAEQQLLEAKPPLLALQKQASTAQTTANPFNYIYNPGKAALKGFMVAGIDTFAKLFVTPYLIQEMHLKNKTAEGLSHGFAILAKTAVIGMPGAIASTTIQLGCAKLLESCDISKRDALKAAIFMGNGFLAMASIYSNPVESLGNMAGITTGTFATEKLIKSLPKFKEDGEGESLAPTQEIQSHVSSLRKREAVIGL